MTVLIDLGADVEWPDQQRASTVRERLETDDRLGALAVVAEWLAGVHPDPDLGPLTGVCAVLVGAEPSEATSAAAESAGVGLHPVPMLPQTVAEAIDAGVALADAEADRGTQLLIVASPGADADCAVAVAVLTNTEPVKVLRRGAAATDPQAWMALAEQVRDGRRTSFAHRGNSQDLVESLHSTRLGFLAGLVLRAAARRTPVILDGTAAAVGALVAYEAQPRAVRWWCAADLGQDKAQEIALNRLGQHSLLGLGSGLGDGLAGVLTVPLLQAATRLIH